MSEWGKVYQDNLTIYTRLIRENLSLKHGWKPVGIDSVLDRKSFNIEGSLLTKDYCKEGKYPIVSQSKDFISGYTNDASLLIRTGLPFVIFGDHTQVVKYIDFPFVLGADGVKLLKPKSDYVPKFFYYMVCSVDLSSKKYARHYKLLRNSKIPIKENSLAIQERAVAFLSDFESNSLKEGTYFDKELEIQLLGLHHSLIDLNGISSETDKQSSLLSHLRQAILQEAVEGKLTADWRKKNPVCKGDPDTDAAALLEKIKIEKQKLIAEGKIKKENPLAPIKPEEAPFDLPEGWAWSRLRGIASIVRGGSPRPAGDKRYYDGDIPFLKVADLTRDNSIYLKTHKYSIKKAGLFKTRFVQSDVLMLTNSGATLGVPKICTFPTTFNDGIAAFLGLSDNFNKVFLYYFLKAKSKWFLAEAARGQGQPNLNTDIIGNTIFGLPSLTEQAAIVERVDRLLTMVGELEKQVAERKTQAEELMQAVLHEAFEGK